MYKHGFGGQSGGAVSHCETLPEVRAVPAPLGVAPTTAHVMGSPRGGYYHCMAEGCTYSTRDAASGKRHSTSFRKER